MASKKRRAVVRWIKRGLIIVFLGAVAAMVVLAWMPKPVPVETTGVARGELTVTVSEDGRSRIKDRYVVSAPLSGKLARIELHPGDQVEQGQVIARIVPVDTPLMDVRTREQAEARVAAAKAGTKQSKAQIVRAKAALKYAEQEVEQIRPLVSQGVESKVTLERLLLDERTRRAELTSAEFASRVADHELRMAESVLGRFDGSQGDEPSEQLEVTSPITGRVLKVIQESEGVVPAGAPLVELGDPAALEVVVDVLTRDAVQIERGAPAAIERWGGEPLRANVRLVEPSAFTRLSSLGVEEQRVNAVLDIDQPYEEWSSLGDGYRVEAKITIWRADDVLELPSSALFRHDEGWAVFVAREGVASLVPVEIGRRNGLQAQIVDGLQEGERVILHPSDRVQDGTMVTWR
ncbi:MAG: HlyD family efflux transporter periplasmic adaptor subunit [Myxococcales bacterium]|nr:HlyD family efflux transporter periplasmic adaptor subunit [Myxococcales bacterium]